MNLTRIQGESDILDLAGRIWFLAFALIMLLVMISKKRLWIQNGGREDFEEEGLIQWNWNVTK